MSIAERPPEQPIEEPRGALSGLAKGSFANSPYWLIVRDRATPEPSRGFERRVGSKLEVLLLEVDGSKVLPLFSCEEEAAQRAQALATPRDSANAGSAANGARGEWRPRGTAAGELISLLSGSAFSAGPCADVERVAVDPPTEVTESINTETSTNETRELPGTSRRCFLETLMGRGRSWFEGRDRSDTE